MSRSSRGHGANRAVSAFSGHLLPLLDCIFKPGDGLLLELCGALRCSSLLQFLSHLSNQSLLRPGCPIHIKPHLRVRNLNMHMIWQTLRRKQCQTLPNA